MAFEITKELIEEVALFIETGNDKALSMLFSEMHYADIAEVLEELSFEEAVYIIKLLDSETTSDILIELDEDIREKIFEQLTAKEIAEEVEELDSDDAADIIGELSEESFIRSFKACLLLAEATVNAPLEDNKGVSHNPSGGFKKNASLALLILQTSGVPKFGVYKAADLPVLW